MKSKLILLFLFLCLSPTNIQAQDNNLKEEYQLNLYKARVIEVVAIERVADTETQTLKIQILNKEFKGYDAYIRNTLVNNGYAIELKVGDNITVLMELDDSVPSFYFHSYEKTNHIIVLMMLFILFVIIFGGLKGFKALISLAITISLILFGLIPLLLKGYNPIVLSIATCMLAAILTFIITNGFTKKTLSAIIGVIGGLLIGGLIAYIFGIVARITGFSSENAQMLQYLPSGVVFDFKGLLFAGIIIGALGACMDVAISIASALNEIESYNPSINKLDLIKSGFNIGKDIMGTMVNTLVLAYTGSSLAMILLFMGFNKSITEIINLDSIATEIIRAISGSMGLLFAIPFTIFAYIVINKRRGV